MVWRRRQFSGTIISQACQRRSISQYGPEEQHFRFKYKLFSDLNTKFLPCFYLRLPESDWQLHWLESLQYFQASPLHFTLDGGWPVSCFLHSLLWYWVDTSKSQFRPGVNSGILHILRMLGIWPLSAFSLSLQSRLSVRNNTFIGNIGNTSNQFTCKTHIAISFSQTKSIIVSLPNSNLDTILILREAKKQGTYFGIALGLSATIIYFVYSGSFWYGARLVDDGLMTQDNIYRLEQHSALR